MAGKSGKKRPPPAPPRGGSAWPLLGISARGLMGLGIVAGVMVLVVWVGGRTGRVVPPRARYTVQFADIECPAPPTADTLRFLTEVRYLGDLPETVQSVDPDLAPRLTAAFARHPWVAAVDGVVVTAAGKIQVAIRYRQPVLAVSVLNQLADRLVDRDGVLLPGPVPAAADLPTLITPQPPPAQQPGQVWASDVVKRAAGLAVTYRPRTIEKTKGPWRLILPDGRVQTVLW